MSSSLSLSRFITVTTTPAVTPASVPSRPAPATNPTTVVHPPAPAGTGSTTRVTAASNSSASSSVAKTPASAVISAAQTNAALASSLHHAAAKPPSPALVQGQMKDVIPAACAGSAQIPAVKQSSALAVKVDVAGTPLAAGVSAASQSPPLRAAAAAPEAAAAPIAAAAAPAVRYASAGLGFRNLGNTCFLNATLQSLCALPPFLQWLRYHARECKHDRERGGHYYSGSGAAPPAASCVPCVLAALFDESLIPIAGVKCITPSSIVDALPRLGPRGRFVQGRQEDAQEFLVHLLDALEIHSLQRARLFGVSDQVVSAGAVNLRESMQAMAYGSIAAWDLAGTSTAGEGVQDSLAIAPPPLLPLGALPICELFRGRLVSRVRCRQDGCGALSDTRDIIESLSVDIPNGCASVTAALTAFTKPERLEGANAYDCLSCKQKVSAEKRLALDVPPQLFTLHLKRFAFRGSYSSKITHNVAFSETLEIGEQLFLSERQHAAASAAGARPLLDARGKPVPGTVSVRYVLCAALVHSGGSSTSGHYYTYVRAFEDAARDIPGSRPRMLPPPQARAGVASSSTPSVWFQLNDSQKSPTTFANVSSQQAYMLFYVAEEPLVFAALADAATKTPFVPKGPAPASSKVSAASEAAASENDAVRAAASAMKAAIAAAAVTARSTTPSPSHPRPPANILQSPPAAHSLPSISTGSTVSAQFSGASGSARAQAMVLVAQEGKPEPLSGGDPQSTNDAELRIPRKNLAPSSTQSSFASNPTGSVAPTSVTPAVAVSVTVAPASVTATAAAPASSAAAAAPAPSTAATATATLMAARASSTAVFSQSSRPLGEARFPDRDAVAGRRGRSRDRGHSPSRRRRDRSPSMDRDAHRGRPYQEHSPSRPFNPWNRSQRQSRTFSRSPSRGRRRYSRSPPRSRNATPHRYPPQHRRSRSRSVSFHRGSDLNRRYSRSSPYRRSREGGGSVRQRAFSRSCSRDPRHRNRSQSRSRSHRDSMRECRRSRSRSDSRARNRNHERLSRRSRSRSNPPRRAYRGWRSSHSTRSSCSRSQSSSQRSTDSRRSTPSLPPGTRPSMNHFRMRNPGAAVAGPKPSEPLLPPAVQPAHVQEATLPRSPGSAEAEERRIAACIASARATAEAVAASAAAREADAAAAARILVLPKNLPMPSVLPATIVVPALSYPYQPQGPQGGPTFIISTKKL
jgi:ubiquitin C-terminal hydrolase